LGIINLEDLKPDMLLESDVIARNGRTILKAGNRIAEKHLDIFKAWGVTEANVHGITKDEAAAAAVEEIDPKTLQRAQLKSEARFRHAGTEHPLLKELLRVCTFRAVKNS
jgi:hypothetical protein